MSRWFARFFGFAGRLDRASWWTRAALVAAMWVAQDAFVDEATVVAVAARLGRSPLALALVWAAVAVWWGLMIWIAAAASVRRLHDRGGHGARLLLFVLPAVIAAHWLAKYGVAWVAVAASLAWMVIELGILPGRRDDGDPPHR